MAGKRESIQQYEMHGHEVASLGRGFDELGMPTYRRATAIEIVHEVLEANKASDFYWYKPPATDELCCYWDDAELNLMWINSGELHVRNDPASVVMPPRPITYTRTDNELVGWLLPGGEAGTGGNSGKPKARSVLCPVTFIRRPVGELCPDCEVEHA